MVGALLHAKDLPVSGTLNGSAQLNGTLSALIGQADVELLKGELSKQPFDRFTAHASYAANTLTVTNGQLTAGASQVFDWPGAFSTGTETSVRGGCASDVTQQRDSAGRIRRALDELHPGIQGTVQVTASGQVEVNPTPKVAYRFDELRADISTKGVQLEGQPLGEAHLTANTQGQTLRAHLDSSIAGSAVKGDGEWRLEGEYRGTATVSFSRVDLASLKPWLATNPGEDAAPFTGSVEGVLH